MTPRGPSHLVGVAIAVLATACSQHAVRDDHGETPRSTMQLTSSAFREGATVPRAHTCDGGDRSPPLRWSGAPAGARSFALITDDPDAPRGTWVHWVVYDMPAARTALLEAITAQEELPDGTRQGRNDFGRIGYGGPCPPPGAAHRYFFKLYALDRLLGLAPGATKADVESAMQGHVLAQAQLVGRYARSR